MQETSTELETTHSKPTLAFKGQGSEFFGIQIVNVLLTLVTLGLYYPWAKAKELQYLYRKTELAGSAFTFHGTGKEMFIGFIKGLGILAVLYGVFFIGFASGSNMVKLVCFLTFFVGFLVLIPIAIHGMLRYRTSRTSWRGIHMGYRGNATKFMKLYLGQFLLTIVTFGIYASWFTVNVRKEIIGNLRFGNAKFKYIGEGSDLFLIHVKAYFFTLPTLGIYLFWYAKELLNFYVNNILIEQNGKYSRLDSEVTGMDYLKLTVVNLFILIFTLGFGYTWVVTRTMNLILSKCEIIGEFNPDELEQTEEEYKNAAYEDMADMLDIGIV